MVGIQFNASKYDENMPHAQYGKYSLILKTKWPVIFNGLIWLSSNVWRKTRLWTHAFTFGCLYLSYVIQYCHILCNLNHYKILLNLYTKMYILQWSHLVWSKFNMMQSHFFLATVLCSTSHACCLQPNYLQHGSSQNPNTGHDTAWPH